MRLLVDSGRPFYGTFVVLQDATSVELAAAAGFDFVILDLEHSALSLERLQCHMQTARGCGLGTMVRVSGHRPELILRVLEIGADGIIVPHVSGREEAKAVVSAARYAPLGARGVYDCTRAGSYGAHGFASYREYADAQNAAVVVAFLIEDKEAVDKIKDVLSVDGVDLAIVGPADLSFSMGVGGTVGDAGVVAAIERVRVACVERGVGFAVPPNHGTAPISPERLLELGVKFFFRSSDAVSMLEGFRLRLASMKSA